MDGLARMSLRACEACDISYSDDAITLLMHEGYKNPTLITASITDEILYDVQCFVYETSDFVEVLFRGSESLQDWIVDFQAIAHPNSGDCYGIHRGFLAAFDSIKAGLVRELKARGDKPISYTGHSLGGALAQVAAYVLYPVYGLGASSVITFGSPRWCNDKVASSYDSMYATLGAMKLRWVNHKDVVTDVPPKALGYKHPDDEVYLDRRGGVHRSPSRMYKMWDRWMGDPPHELLSDHFISEYLKRLRGE